jgi:hypothetical protein
MNPDADFHESLPLLKNVARVADYRRLLDRKDIDAVLAASPLHLRKRRRLIPHCITTPFRIYASAPAFRRQSFIPAMLMREEASGVPAPRQCVSRLTA